MRFFFYGTLTADSDNPVARQLHTLLLPAVPATVRGRLYAIEDQQGWYPGLVPDHQGNPVHGFLHETAERFGPEDLAELDRYENFDPLRPDLSEFIRREIAVEAVSTCVPAIAYVLRVPPVKSIVTVTDGSFSGFLRRRGLRSYCAAYRAKGG